MRLKEYIENIQEKTLLIACHDYFCNCGLVSNDRIIVHNLFGTFFSSVGSFDQDYILQCIHDFGIERIIISGHTKCTIQNLLLNDTICGPRYKEQKFYLKHIKRNLSPFIIGSEGIRNFKRVHILKQMRKISKLEFIDDKMRKSEIRISGLMIDDENEHEIEEITFQPENILHLMLN